MRLGIQMVCARAAVNAQALGQCFLSAIKKRNDLLHFVECTEVVWASG